ncbi:elongation factor Tu, putative, partial [Eimeria necatrix]
VGVLLKGARREELRRGMVLTVPGSLRGCMRFKSDIYVLSSEEGGRKKPFFSHYRPQLFLRTADVAATVVLPEGTEMAMPGDRLSVEMRLEQPLALQPQLRFALREGGKTVAAGVVTEVLD